MLFTLICLGPNVLIKTLSLLSFLLELKHSVILTSYDDVGN